MALRRAAIYGGTFDPVHNGHIEVADRVLELFELDEVIFVPACVPPHKRGTGITSAWHRFAMLALATQHDARLRLSTIELDAPERPYAVDTVERMQGEVGSGLRLFFMIGADSWAELNTWHEWQTLLKMCDLIVVTRPGYDLSANFPAEIAKVVDARGMSRQEISELLRADSGPRVFLSDAAMIDVSATTIRAAARSKSREKLSEKVPAEVASYIDKYNLYRN
ncbi:MAG: nicotinate-nucleotide adenylyltransferase [Acidobacteriota bacterium]